MFSLRFGSSHVSIFNCIYKIIEHKVKINVLCPALRLRYNNAIANAVAELGSADQIRRVFVGCQRLSVPGVDQPHPGARKVCGVACHQCQVVLQRCGSQQTVHRRQGSARAGQ